MLDYRVSTFLTLYDEMNYRRTAERLNMMERTVYLNSSPDHP